MRNEISFIIKPENIKALKTGLGGCFATNMITVEGKRMNFFYRERPDSEIDSGWRFFSGYEDDEYINDPENTQVFDVNTIANLDPNIIPFLDAPYNSAFERNPNTGNFEQVYDFEFPEE